MSPARKRIEKDTMGEMEVPEDALWGASTQRAVLNFPVSGRPMPARFIRALGLVKWAAAQVNVELGLLDAKRGEAIMAAALEVSEGKLDAHFPVDVFQTGSGTSSNMNANEVIANRAIQILGGKIGDKSVHPNDHVNVCQSSNDVVPASIRIAAMLALRDHLVPALRRLQEALAAKAREFDPVIKIGRTHLMDATPITLGQEASGWARAVDLGARRIEAVYPRLCELPTGGTAVGTGINSHPEFGSRLAAALAARTGAPFSEAENHFEAQGASDAPAEASAAVRVVASSLMKIANDIRILASGPRCGIGELRLQALQPGSSIMPGKVNPVICESVIQVAAQVSGNDIAVSTGQQWGQLELNTMLPVQARNLLESIELLGSVARLFADKVVAAMEADAVRAESLIESSNAMVTALAPRIGYDKAAEIAKESLKTGKTVRQLVKERKLMPDDEVDRLLDPRSMLRPSADKVGSGGG
jgi:fumarate hydratase class II